MGMFTPIPKGNYNATQHSADIVRTTEKGIHVVSEIYVAPGVDTVTITVEGKVADGTYYSLLSSVASAATGVISLKIRPGLIPVNNSVQADGLPDIYRVTVTHSGVGVFNYDVHLNTLQ